ncbi:MAG: hypothetical protein KDB53_02490, partial [Planctomycetes bacterium]|nr:hypothetical protein [Planctomycetota bacterium]
RAFRAVVQAARDGRPENDVGHAGVFVEGPGRIAYVTMGGGDDRLDGVLSRAGVVVDRRSPASFPRHPAGWVGQGACVLDDVPAWTFDAEQLSALETAVRELGLGLVMVGGPQSFAAGGWRGTTLADLAPVDLDASNRKTMPKGALVVVLHSIEFDSGNTWAQRICDAALQGLRPHDEMGIVYYSWDGGERWLFDLSPVGDGKAMSQAIESVAVGDMPSFDQSFRFAEKSLASSTAAVKHIVVISDGDPQAPDPAVLQRLVAGRVTISGVAIATHGQNTLPAVVRTGGGRYHEMTASDGDLRALPQFMIKEAATLRRASFDETPFVPLVQLGSSALLVGLESGLPILHGRNICSPRARAETILLADEKEKDALLATWYFGLGRVTAFCSDATTRWAKDWVAWEQNARFWSRIVRSVQIAAADSAFQLRADVDGDLLRLEMDAEDADGRALETLVPRAAIMGAGEETKSVVLRPLGAGRYGAEVPLEKAGHYLVRVDAEHEGKRLAAFAAAALDYGAEAGFLRSDEAALVHAAGLTGGREVDAGDDPFRRDFAPATGGRDLHFFLLALALPILLLDLLVRRFGWVRAGPRVPRTRRQETATVPAAPATRESAADDRDEDPPAPPPSRPTAAGKTDALEALNRARRRAEKRREWR